MPDITLCPGRGCPKREKCYRFKAKPSEWLQSYFVETPWYDESCEYLIPLIIPKRAKLKAKKKKVAKKKTK